MKTIGVFYQKIFSFWRWNFLCIWIGVFIMLWWVRMHNTRAGVQQFLFERLHVRPAKTKISLQADQSSLSAWRLFWSLATHRLPCEDADLTRDAQAGLSFRWAHVQSCRKRCVPAQKQTTRAMVKVPSVTLFSLNFPYQYYLWIIKIYYLPSGL